MTPVKSTFIVATTRKQPALDRGQTDHISLIHDLESLTFNPREPWSRPTHMQEVSWFKDTVDTNGRITAPDSLMQSVKITQPTVYSALLMLID